MFPKISGGKIWLPFTVETDDGTHACGMFELSPKDPSYQETKKWLEALERGEWSLFPGQEGELDQANRFKDALEVPPLRRSEA
jgi:hypothetical protein